jgi:predicted transcriptional regulator
MILNIV